MREDGKMKDKPKMLVIYGCGGHGHNIADVILANDPASCILFVDDNAREGESKLGFSIVKQIPKEVEQYSCIVASGNNLNRKRKFAEIEQEKIISVISPRAFIGYRSIIGKGSYIGHFAMVGAEAIIGENVSISYASVVGHETQIGSHSFVGPNATIMGKVNIDELVFVGGGATIIGGVKICSKTIIGAGATVVRDILEQGTYVGTPARRIK